MESSLPKKTFETMNGLRGLAALLVVVWHGGSDWYGNFVPPSSYLAVDLFFVLSGFVIAYSYQGRLAEGMTTRQFLIIRLVRLYPLYFLGTIISCAVALIWSLIHLQIGSSLAVAIRSIPFAFAMLPTPSWISGQSYGDLYPLNVPAWSLFCEIVINLVYAASYRLWSIRNILVMMGISAALMLSIDWFEVKQGWGGGGFNWTSMPFGFFRVFYSFPAGVLIYRLIYEKKFSLPNIGNLTVFAILPFLFVWHSELSCKLSMFFGFPLLVAFGSFSEPVGVIRRVCAQLGSASYAIYAIHFPLIGFVLLAQGKFGFDPSSRFIGVLFLATIVPLSLIIDKWFDNPIRSILTSRFVHPFLFKERDRLTVTL
jgi:peptidoglycan/LPS O-acetylase OafA/YrhL